MLEDIGAHMAKGPGRPAKEFVPDAEGSQCSTRLEEPLLRNFGAPGDPPSSTESAGPERVALDCDATVAGRGRRAALRAGGREAVGQQGAGHVMQINARDISRGRGQPGLWLGGGPQAPGTGVTEATLRRGLR